ncbi:hypothetical protein T492DRAFT_979196 [Pavlovales sp. CCMP2436]|nr:hypothetical protein T492DRAFT_979196 [Pavlovales sp. CCMP2436]|mmetsp:Transcript_42760/g.99073  ORF Transcript_42760/g.99073 Transcript_42760/m.99073 type:complete len:267 (-) Transcript_42760:52-852(-)
MAASRIPFCSAIAPALGMAASRVPPVQGSSSSAMGARALSALLVLLAVPLASGVARPLTRPCELNRHGLVTMKAGAPKARGFGAPKQPSLPEVLASMASRLPADPVLTPCACGSGEMYRVCCEPYHRGEAVAATAERVVRARYSAFAYRQPLYLVNTTHPVNRDFNEDVLAWVKLIDREGMFDSFEFLSLDIADEEEGESTVERFVAFTVMMRAISEDDGIAAGTELKLSERSRFLPNCAGDGWLYANGEVRAVVDNSGDDIVMNR